MPTEKELIKHTEEFFKKHWNLDEAIPEWDSSYDWNGPVPNYLLGGVYALLRDQEVVYIGKGNSKGSGIYEDRGISRRLMQHVLKRGGLLKKKWQEKGVNGISTLGFPRELNYLASALEEYLLQVLSPIENKQMK